MFRKYSILAIANCAVSISESDWIGKDMSAVYILMGDLFVQKLIRRIPFQIQSRIFLIDRNDDFTKPRNTSASCDINHIGIQMKEIGGILNAFSKKHSQMECQESFRFDLDTKLIEGFLKHLLVPFFQKKVFLQVFVKVEPNWREDKKMLKKFGYIQD